MYKYNINNIILILNLLYLTDLNKIPINIHVSIILQNKFFKTLHNQYVIYSYT